MCIVHNYPAGQLRHYTLTVKNSSSLKPLKIKALKTHQTNRSPF